MAKPRIRVVGQHPETGVLDREGALALFENLEAILFEFGGMVVLTADREVVGHAGDEPVYATVGLVAQYAENFPVAPPRAQVVEPEVAAPEPEPVGA